MKLLALTILLVSSPLTPAASAKPAAAANPHMAKKPFVPTSQYVERGVLGWKVLVNEELLGARAEVGGKALALLEEKLRGIRDTVPEAALTALERVPIWIGVDDYAAPNACYHPSADWLRTHGWNPDKAGAVEIGNAAIFLDWSRTQPMMVLHELAHAFHHQVLTHQHAGIRSAYEQAKKSGSYEEVSHVSGGRQRAYAMNNEQEFFAEISEAYFGRNDFYPFTRADLAQHDPALLQLIAGIWHTVRPAP
jgi:dipeptidyl-peptidase-4